MNKVMYPTTPREERHDIPWITDLEGLHEWIDSIIAGVKDMLHTHQISICGTFFVPPCTVILVLLLPAIVLFAVPISGLLWLYRALQKARERHLLEQICRIATQKKGDYE